MDNEQAGSFRISSYEEPVDYLYGEAVDRVVQIQDRKMVIATWRAAEAELSFLVLSSSSDAPEDGGKSTIPGGLPSIQQRLSQIASVLKTASSRAYLSDNSKESLLQNLEGMGAALFEELLPPVLQRIIQTWTDGAWLSISSNEQWVPWELLHDGRGFLARRFMLFRLPRRPSRGEVLQGRRGKSESTPLRKIVYAIGGNLKPEHVSVCSQYFRDISSSLAVKALQEMALVDLMKEIEDADLVHLTCHGHLNPLRLQITRDDDPLIGLTIDSLKAPKFRVKSGCLVFANACSSAATESQFGDRPSNPNFS